MKQYRLLKDLPVAKAGVVINETSIGTLDFVDYPKGYYCSFNKKFIEDNPDWFEEVKPFEWTDELVKKAVQFYVRHEKNKSLMDIIEEFKQLYPK